MAKRDYAGMDRKTIPTAGTENLTPVCGLTLYRALASSTERHVSRIPSTGGMPVCRYRIRDPASMPSNTRPPIGYHSGAIVTVWPTTCRSRQHSARRLARGNA
jgi:hypothetical protein